MRMNCVGTMCVCVHLYLSMSRNVSSASQRSMHTTVCFMCIELPANVVTAV
jgi:hypothetical protein